MLRLQHLHPTVRPRYVHSSISHIVTHRSIFVHVHLLLLLLLLLLPNLSPRLYTTNRPVESRNLHTSGTKGDMVTYRYYVGRLYMFEDHYDQAEENLDYALRHCRKDALKNKKCILQYLVPVKMLRGRLPTTTRKSIQPSYSVRLGSFKSAFHRFFRGIVLDDLLIH